MIIRKTQPADLDEVMIIYREAREFMKNTGNPTQWWDGYPPRELIEADIAAGDSFVVEEDGSILAVFLYKEGIDPTYINIENGTWLNNEPYGVIHRIAVRAKGRGVAAFVFNTVYTWCGNIRIDTHEDNTPMRNALLKNGFKYCGVIHIANGDPRIAFQRIEGEKNEG